MNNIDVYFSLPKAIIMKMQQKRILFSFALQFTMDIY